MSSVQFDEPQIQFRTIDISGAVTHNTPLLIKTGVVKNLKQANIVMMITFFVCLVVTIVMIKSTFFTSSIKYKEDFTPDQLKHLLPETVANLPSKNDPNAQK